MSCTYLLRFPRKFEQFTLILFKTKEGGFGIKQKFDIRNIVSNILNDPVDDYDFTYLLSKTQYEQKTKHVKLLTHKRTYLIKKALRILLTEFTAYYCCCFSDAFFANVIRVFVDSKKYHSRYEL